MRRLAVVLLAAASAACGPTVSVDCAATALEEAISPDGRYVATSFQRECGPEAALSTALGVRDARAAFDPAEQPTLFVVDGQRELAFEWSSARSLTVSLPPSGDVLERADTWRDVRVDYE